MKRHFTSVKQKFCLVPGEFICFAFNLIGESSQSSDSVSVSMILNLVNHPEQIVTSDGGNKIKAFLHFFRTFMSW